jgi:hypothetical protein
LIVTIGVIVGSLVGRTSSFIALNDAVGNALGKISSICFAAGSTDGAAVSIGVDVSNGLDNSGLGFSPIDVPAGGL